jgi:predicted permease
VPEWKKEIRERLASLKLAPTREAEIVDELAQHLEDQYDELLLGGATAEEAHRLTLVELSESELLAHELRRVEREFKPEPVVIGARRMTLLRDLWQDLRYGLRMMRKSPAFTAVAVLSLALGIGANTAIFNVIDTLMLRKLPVREPEQLVMFYTAEPGSPSGARLASLKEFEKYRSLTQVFTDVAAISHTDRFNITVNGSGGGSDAGLVRVALVSGNYFFLLGVNAVVGRTLLPDDDRVAGEQPVAVISYAFWERRFARASDVVGRTLTMNGTSYTILGVTPRGFSGEWVGRPVDLWIPTVMQAQVMPEYPTLVTSGGVWLRLVGRLKPGVPMQQAQAVGQIVYQQNMREFWPNPTPSQARYMTQAHLELRSAANGYSPQRDSFAQSLAILGVMIGLVLLIACANIANLLLARSAARQREMALRLALGAATARIVRQLLTESILLAVMGGALGLLFSVWAATALSTTLPLGPVQTDSREASQWVSFDLYPDWRVFAFTAALCLLTGVLFGLAPAFRGSKTSLSPALTGRGSDSGSFGGRFALGKMLVIAQVALSIVLLIGAGLFLRTMRNLRSVDLGFDRQHLLLVWTSPGQTGRQGPAIASLVHDLQDRLSSLPGVLSASASSAGLLTGTSESGGAPSEDMKVEGEAPKAGLLGVAVQIAPKYFETVGAPLLLGRDFTERDTETSPQVTIINQTMAHFYFGNQNPIGRHFGFSREVGMPWEIVGVVRDMKFGTPRDKKIVIYLPYRQRISFLRNLCIMVRTVGNPASVASSVRQELREVDPNLPVLRIDTVDEQLNDVLVQERLIMALSSFFGAVAVLLACIGLYGVISYTVARRTNEIGIRLALGATPGKVLSMVLKESLLLVFLGIAIGVPAALAATRLISARLFGVSAADPLTLAAAALLMIGVAALAAFLPALRASKVDPLVALRYE